MGANEPNESSRPIVPRMHGLIIGINRYARSNVHPDLLGCVGDAKSMLKFFMDLGVPEYRFRCLYNEAASREAILAAFVEHLINNSNIRRHDPIVIYFAGHGDRMPAPRGWQTTDGNVEMILPHDVSTMDARGHYNYGIPDLTLAFLLYKLSLQKGNNITVILDSCHSGSGTRGDVRLRSSHDPNAPPIPIELDSRLRKSLSVDYPSEVEHDVTSKQPSGTILTPSLESHVLLAACQDEEQAQEVPNVDPDSGEIGDPVLRGLFTTALLKQLKNCDLAATSYTTLIRNLLANRPKTSPKIGPQTFQCEGRNQDRLLFSVQYSNAKGKISLIPTSDKSVYRVRVGSAQGVVPGTEFGVFPGKTDPTSPPVAILVAKDVGPLISQLYGQEPNAPPDIPTDAYVTIIKFNDHSNGVRIWVDEQIRRNEFWQRILTSPSLDSLPIFWAASPENHDISLRFSDGDVEFRGAHLTPGEFGGPHILRRARGAKQLAEILTTIIYFHCHLKIRNKDAPVRKDLSMTLRELKEKDRSWGSTIYEVKGEDLFGDSVPAGTVATLHPDCDKVFGMELTNTSQENLFPYVLYYDFEDYSVGCLYEPPGRSVKAPLPAGKSITIGYGSAGSQPFQVDFTNPRSDKEYGAFVLMVFSEWVDVAYLQQDSPFGPIPDGRGERSGRFGSGVWDNLIVRVEMVKRK